jgi:Spermine/spermidine synthase domain
MSSNNERRFIFPELSTSGDTVLRIREPTEMVPDVLFGRILDGIYGKPFLVEDLEFRAMCFSLDGSTQSEMRLDDPEALVSAYTRKMMGFLLFRARPQRILMIGLGGGSLVKFCHRHLPTTHITTVEIDAQVIALRPHFHVPPDDSRLRILNEDGVRYVAHMAHADQRTDVMRRRRIRSARHRQRRGRTPISRKFATGSLATRSVRHESSGRQGRVRPPHRDCSVGIWCPRHRGRHGAHRQRRRVRWKRAPRSTAPDDGYSQFVPYPGATRFAFPHTAPTHKRVSKAAVFTGCAARTKVMSQSDSIVCHL